MSPLSVASILCNVERRCSCATCTQKSQSWKESCTRILRFNTIGPTGLLLLLVLSTDSEPLTKIANKVLPLYYFLLFCRLETSTNAKCHIISVNLLPRFKRNTDENQ